MISKLFQSVMERLVIMDHETVLNMKSLKEQVYDYLRQQMTSGVIQPGSVVNLDATSRRLGVSKTPLREALIMLEVEGFVTILPRKGVYVNQLTRQDIRELYQILGALESSALLAAAEQFSLADLTRMKELNTGMADAVARNNFDEYYQCNLAFHNQYLERAGNRSLVKLAATLKKRLYDFPRQIGFIKEWEESSIGEHGQIISLTEAGDYEGAARFIRDVHWSFKHQEKYIVKYYPLD